MAIEVAPSPPNPRAYGETLPPQMEKGRKPPPTLSFSTHHSLRSQTATIYTLHATRFLYRVIRPRFAAHKVAGRHPDQRVALLAFGRGAVAHEAFDLLKGHPLDPHHFGVGGV